MKFIPVGVVVISSQFSSWDNWLLSVKFTPVGVVVTSNQFFQLGQRVVVVVVTGEG